MIAVDTNVLVYAYHSKGPHHRRARETLRALAEGDAAWALPVFVVGEFLRVVTHRHGPLRQPATVDQALEAVEALLGSPSVRLLLPGDRYLPLLHEVVRDADARGNLAFDAQIAAVCLEHGATTILTEDHDFRRFTGLTVRGLG